MRRRGRGLALVAAVALVACDRPAPAGGPFDWLFVGSRAPGRFLHVSSYDTTGGNADRLEIAAGDSAVLLDAVGPGVIRRLWITVASRDPQYLRRIALEMYWDGERDPSVAAPLGDFFGNGFSKKHYTAIAMGESSGGFYCYLPMPFRSHARIVAVNGTGRPIDAFYYNIDFVTDVRLPRDVATFHAWWHRDPRTTTHAPHLILAARGRGHLVGVSLNAESYGGGLGFLEGDEIWTVDGQFRGQGTGTEDYFNSGWYFDEGPYGGPWHGLIVKDEKAGRIAAYRWHLPDPVPFRDSIRVAIEHGTENTEVADYATMAYWYQTEPHALQPPLPPPDRRLLQAVKIPPTAVLAESLPPVARHGDRMELTVPVPRPDRYAVVEYPLGADHLVKPPVPRGIQRAARAVTLSLGGGDTLLAAVEAVPVRAWAREWAISGPFPNPRTMGSEHSPALDSVYPPERDAGRPEEGAALGGGGKERWRRVRAGADGQVRLVPLYRPSDWVAVYAGTFLYSPRAQPVTLLLGADDAHQLWVNGALVSRRQGRHESKPDDVSVPVPVRAGWNAVLLKVANLDGGWAFQLRAADPAGELRWSARPGRPLRSPGSTP